MTIGGIDHTKYIGGIAYTPVIPIGSLNAGFWMIRLYGLNIGEVSLSSNPQGIPIVVDSGTTLIVVDHSTYYSLLFILGITSAIDPFGNIDCSYADFLPPIYFHWNTHYCALSAQNYIIAYDYGLCQFGFQPGEAWIAGDVFLRAYYTVFDIGRMQVGLAMLPNSTNPNFINITPIFKESISHSGYSHSSSHIWLLNGLISIILLKSNLQL